MPEFGIALLSHARILPVKSTLNSLKYRPVVELLQHESLSGVPQLGNSTVGQVSYRHQPCQCLHPTVNPGAEPCIPDDAA